MELGQCIPDPPVTDCSILVTNDASTDIFLRVATEVRSRLAKSLLKEQISILLGPLRGKTWQKIGEQIPYQLDLT